MSPSHSMPEMMTAIRWHPPAFDIRVESIPVPKIQDPDDAIVKVTLAALCGSDLHIYRGHGGVDKVHTSGHEFIGEVVELGSSYGAHSKGRPELYATLKVGDKVVSPFTVNCGECDVCRLGYTCRCPLGALFGSPALEGGQAQYVRVPKAGGTLFNLSDPKSWHSTLPPEMKHKALEGIADSSLLMLADILPTGVFAALQALNHPKVLPAISGKPWPFSFFPGDDKSVTVPAEDRVLTFAIIGLGPVGLCACVSLLDMLSTQQLPFRIVAIDPVESRREKAMAVYAKIDQAGKGSGKFVAESIDDAKKTVATWTGGVGCTAVLEIVGNTSAISLAYDLVRPFGAIVSVGVHGEPQMPFTGRQLYNKNVSFDFGRCPARAMFPMAFDLLVKRQDVFGEVGGLDSLVDRVIGAHEAPETYAAFDQSKIGKAVFDMWK
ncbi:alcohol dehydrogenase [Mycena sanguinolenta]|uniref:Alcohol dehydrogenase n=1 Tax=Mycena sanguinolenta TaxID=230812 RepID=A0A8H6XTI7_9AGAR|nr:alcohol dehydrogenase [Mycena sanguinolenta]